MNTTGLNVGGFSPGKRIAAQILITGGVTVNINGIALDATNGVNNCLPDPGNALEPVGVYFQHASGSVTNAAFKNHTNTCSYPGQGGPQGAGVLIQSSTAPAQSVTVQYSSFRNSGYMAVEASSYPTTAVQNVTMDSNTLVGPGGTNGNGLWISFATTGSITNNSISDALRTADGTGYWGIIAECASNVTISGNTIGNTDTAIALDNPSGCPSGTGVGNNIITSNYAFDSRTEGMRACGSSNAIENNTFNDNGTAAIDFTQGCQSKNNFAIFNSINGACAAVLVGNDASANLSAPNTIFNAKNLQLAGTSCTGGFAPDALPTAKTLPALPQP
jgi:hypothetical protein